MRTREFYSASFIVLCLIIAAFCVHRSGPTKTRTEHCLSKWRSVVAEAKTTYWAPFNADKQKHITNYGGTVVLGLPKYWSCALLSTKDGTHDMQQVSVLRL